MYLLSGHIRCASCHRNYRGVCKESKVGRQYYRYYRCSGNLQMVSPVRCGSRNVPADKVEALIWQEVEKLLQGGETWIANTGA